VWHTGVPDRVLYPTQAPAPARPGEEPEGTAAPKPKTTPKKQRSKDPASGLRKRLARAERDWEAAEAAVIAAQKRLADPDLYKVPEEAAAAVAEHGEAKDRAASLMSEWDRLNARLGN